VVASWRDARDPITRELAQWRLDSESDEEVAEAEFHRPND